LLACLQAVRLRLRDGGLERDMLGADLAAFLDDAGGVAPFIEEDAPLDGVLIDLCARISAGQFSLSFKGA
jgi:histidine ammonia-lyase